MPFFLGLDLNIDSTSRTVTAVLAAESLDASRPTRVCAADAPSTAAPVSRSQDQCPELTSLATADGRVKHNGRTKQRGSNENRGNAMDSGLNLGGAGVRFSENSVV